jgi:hypothetical protein
MQVVYEGPFDAVEIPALGLDVARGVPFDVDDGAGEALCAQSDFSESKTESKSKKETS